MRSSDMVGGSDHPGMEPIDLGDAYNDHPASNSPSALAPRAPRGPEMAGEVIQFPNPTVMPETTRVKNHIAQQNRRLGGTPSEDNVIKIPNDRYK